MSFFKKKDKDSTKAKKSWRFFRTPVALHFYSAFTVIILFFFIGFNLGFNRLYESYIEKECTNRIDSASKSCNSFLAAYQEAFKEIDKLREKEEKLDKNQYRQELFNLISSSTDLTNDASMAMFYEDPTEDDDSNVYKISLIYPSEDMSDRFTQLSQDILNQIEDQEDYKFKKSSLENTKEILTKTIEYNGIQTGEIQTITVDGAKYYYRFEKFIPTDDSSKKTKKTDKKADSEETYYLFFYIDTSNYYSFADKLNNAIFKVMMLAIVVAGILSIIISFPIISSTRRLSKFANRISKGDFKPYKGLIASRELNELSSTMNKMAQKLDENDKEQKTFFQNASHELRTPLMSIQGYAEGMKYGIFDEDHQEEAVDIIISETTRLSNMVENLLSISKMDLSAADSYEVKKTIVDVYELLGVTIDKIRGGFLHNDKELVNNIRIKSGVHIYANENDIFRMLENIFSNCLRYAESKVFFTCYTQDTSVIFEISDDGPGISDEVMANLFKRFAKGSDGKHGIGLALVKAIAEEHDGTVEAGNKPEGGAIFKVKIPMIKTKTQLSLFNKSRDN